MIKLSRDGYVRLTLDALSTVALDHLYTCADMDFTEELREQGIVTPVAGFTEWKTAETPAVSIGFAWYVRKDLEGYSLHIAPDPIRTNVMLVGGLGYDLGNENAGLLRTWLDLFNWQSAVEQAISMSSSHAEIQGAVC